MFDEWVPDDHFSATRNDQYWQDGLPYLDRIEFRPIPDISARFDGLEAGDIDAAEANSQGETTLAELRDEGFTVIDDFDNVGVTTLLMNNESAPVDDPSRARGDRRRHRSRGVPRHAARSLLRGRRPALP